MVVGIDHKTIAAMDVVKLRLLTPDKLKTALEDRG